MVTICEYFTNNNVAYFLRYSINSTTQTKARIWTCSPLHIIKGILRTYVSVYAYVYLICLFFCEVVPETWHFLHETYDWNMQWYKTSVAALKLAAVSCIDVAMVSSGDGAKKSYTGQPSWCNFNRMESSSDEEGYPIIAPKRQHTINIYKMLSVQKCLGGSGPQEHNSIGKVDVCDRQKATRQVIYMVPVSRWLCMVFVCIIPSLWSDDHIGFFLCDPLCQHLSRDEHTQ